MEDTNTNEGNRVATGTTEVVEGLYTILPDLYRMARVAYNIQSDELSRQEAGLLNVMLNAKIFLVDTASRNNGLEHIKDIVSDNISNAPAPLDPPPNYLNVELEKQQGT